MHKTKIFSMLVTILIVTMIFGLTFCSKDNQEPKQPDLQDLIIGKWFSISHEMTGLLDNTKYSFDFKSSKKYSYVVANETFNGDYKIVGQEKTTCDIYNLYTGEYAETIDATLFKMLASGSNVYDQLWVYYLSSRNSKQAVVRLYSGNSLVQNLGVFSKDY